MLDENDMNQNITVIGAGAAGFSAALELAEKGFNVTLIEKETLGSGASSRNPGRMGHGFHYVDIETAKAYLHASVQVQKTYPGFLVGEELPFDSPLRHGRYFITKDSNPKADKILATYQAIKDEYQNLVDLDPTNKVFGEPGEFFRILNRSEYCNIVNEELVELGVETAEHLFKWKPFAEQIKKKIVSNPKIKLLEHTEVINISRNGQNAPRFSLSLKTENGEISSIDSNFIVNSTWHEIERLNDLLGIRMIPGERTNRLKTLLILKLPKSLENTHSMFFCMGQHCMISNLGNGLAMATFAKITNLETSSALCVSKNTQELLDGKISLEEKNKLAGQMLEGISHYIPDIAQAEIIDLQFGIVQTAGTLSLSQLNDPSHPFNKRADHRVRTEQIGLISNPCVKLFYFNENGKIVAQLIEEHIHATKMILRCMKEIKYQAKKQLLEFDEIIERAILERLERYEWSNLDNKNVNNIVDKTLNEIKARSTRFRFLFGKNYCSTKKASNGELHNDSCSYRDIQSRECKDEEAALLERKTVY